MQKPKYTSIFIVIDPTTGQVTNVNVNIDTADNVTPNLTGRNNTNFGPTDTTVQSLSIEAVKIMTAFLAASGLTLND